ncbi:hypothetical protein [Nocardia transvalensis]|uniref:hypothetical protein n=1 Tax=Nocardia transvalensis TaxID=37333 RepID=UPI001895D9BB|nr:hypothetical protein [Nocardia transvalensis]MBF6333489.1 hypothetical protein [Nocardia transvalensis]
MRTSFFRRRRAASEPAPAPEIQPALPDLIWNGSVPDPGAAYEDVAVCLGRDKYLVPVAWRPIAERHLALIGPPESGRAAAARTVVTDLAARGWRVWIVDGGVIDFLGFRDWPNVQVVTTDAVGHAEAIHSAWQEMEKRYGYILDGIVAEADLPPMTVVFNDVTNLKAEMEHRSARFRTVLYEFASLVRKAGAVRMHLVLALSPNARALNSAGWDSIQDHIGKRVSFGALSPTAAAMIWGDPTLNTLASCQVRGRALVSVDGCSRIEAQCLNTPDPRGLAPSDPRHDILERLRPARTTHARIEMPPEPKSATAW